MEYRELDKQAIKQNGYVTLSKITIVDSGFEMTQDDYLIDWNYEDYRYVPNNGFIGEFVERILDGNLSQLPSDVIIEDKELNLQIGIVNSLDNKTTWYDYGNFLVTKVEEQDTNGRLKFESSDYTKKFNIAYVDAMTYPCTALQLANNVCEQAGVELETTGKAYTYIVTDDENGLVAGDYAIQVNGIYYKFKTTSNLKKNDSITFIASNNKLIVRSVDENFNVVRTELAHTTSSSVTVSVLDVTECNYCNFINNDFVIKGNQFTDDSISCRDVIKDIAKLAYSWVRVGTDNKVHIDFHKKSISDVDTYNELTTEEYYTSKKQDLLFGPVNKVLIGMSQVEGENRFKTSDTYTEETECAIKIYDNKLTYTDELRMIALNGAESLFDLEYTPLTINSIGHPWLEADDYIKLTNVDSDVLYTYPFDRKMEYKGYITTTLQSIAQTATQTAYENSNTLFDKISRTEIIVDKQNKKITAVVDDVDTITKKTTTSVSVTNYPIEIEDAGAYELESIEIDGNSEQNGTPTPTTPSEVKSVKGITNLANGERPLTTQKNVESTLLNSTLTLNGISNSNGSYFGDSVSTSGVKIGSVGKGTYTIRIKSVGGTITIPSGVHSAMYIRKINSEVIKNSSITSSNIDFITTNIYTEQTDLYLQMYGNGANIVFDNLQLQIQIVEGETPKSFVPYGTWLIQRTTNQNNEVSSALIDMNIYDEDRQIIGNYELCSIGDIKDTFENGVLTKRIGKVDLSTLTWTQNEAGTGYKRYVCNVNDIVSTIDNNIKYVGSTHFISSTFNETVNALTDANRICVVSNKRLLVKVIDSDLMTLDTFKTWLANNKVYAYYLLNEPQTYNLNYTNLSLFQGYNHISLESDINPSNMEIDYLTDSTFNEQYVNQSQFTIKTDEISSEVSKSVSLSQQAVDGLSDKLDTNTYDNFYKTEYTKFVEDSNSFQMEFDTTYKNKINETENNVLEIKDYIRFENGNIILSGYEVDSQGQKTPVEFEMRIEKDRIGIYRNGALLSSWVQNVFEVEQINMGNFAFIPRANGSLSFRKVK